MDQKILSLSLQTPSITDAEIGEQVGLSRSAVTKRKLREGYQNALDSNFRITQGSLQQLLSKAIHEIGALVDHPDPRIRLSASSVILKFMPEMPIAVERDSETKTFKIGWQDEPESAEHIQYVASWSE